MIHRKRSSSFIPLFAVVRPSPRNSAEAKEIRWGLTASKSSIGEG